MINTQFIESLRLSHGYSQEQISTMLGYETHSAYSRKIKNAKRFNIEDIVKLCNIFNVELDQLIILEKVGK